MRFESCACINGKNTVNYAPTCNAVPTIKESTYLGRLTSAMLLAMATAHIHTQKQGEANNHGARAPRLRHAQSHAHRTLEPHASVTQCGASE